jgi:hypothetical protein
VKISDETVSIADLLTFVIEVEQKEGVQARLPELAELDFGGFLVRDFKRIPEVTDAEGTSTHGAIYVLEPQLSGDYVIQPFEVKFVLKDESTAEEEAEYPHSVETKPFTIEVTSLSEGDSRAVELRPIQGPVDLPRPPVSRWKLFVFLGATAAMIVLIAAVIIAGRRYRPKAISKPVPPHVRALEALRRLRDRKLIEQGLIKEFYYELSNIMRHYIERRFGLTAPEQTTEEFLVAVSRDDQFDTRTRELLGSYLEHCDLVKFAKYAPETAEIQRSFNVTRDFIEQTKVG